MKNKIFSLILTLALCAGLVPTTYASASDTTFTDVLNGDTVRFTGCISKLASYYNYVVLWVVGNHQEVPIYPNVPFELEAKVDIARLEQIYGGDISVSTSYVTAMVCQNHTPGSTSLGGFSFPGDTRITLALNGQGGCTLQVVEAR